VDNAAVVQRHFSWAQFNVDRPGFVNLGLDFRRLIEQSLLVGNHVMSQAAFSM